MHPRLGRLAGVPAVVLLLSLAATIAAGVGTTAPRDRLAAADTVPGGLAADAPTGDEPLVNEPGNPAEPVPMTIASAPTTAPDSAAPPQLAAIALVRDERPAPLPGADWAAFDRVVLDALGPRNAAVAVAVNRRSVLVHEGARGWANRAIGERATADSKFRIASNSKTFTAVAVLQLVAEGKVGLDEPVLERLARSYGVSLGSSSMRQVTLRTLLSHRSGFDDYIATFFRNGAVGCQDAAARALQGRLRSTPGGAVNYSNMNFCILSQLAELIGGDGYSELVTTKILDPLGITGMRLVGNGELGKGEVIHAEGVNRNFMDVLDGAGSWISSPKDMVRFLDSLDPDRPGFHPLPANLAREMWMPRGSGLGLGMRIWGNTWGHTGTIQSSHSIMVHRPDGFTVAITVSGESPYETDDLLGYISRGLRAAGLA